MKTLLRWLKFNAAGSIGIGVQMLVLTALVRWMHYLPATVLAVEVAVLHNFAWHEGLTWRDRTSAPPGDILPRLLRFHLANGLVSLLGNLLFMRLLVGNMEMALMPANMLSIAVCGFVNFAASECFVFAPSRRRIRTTANRMST